MIERMKYITWNPMIRIIERIYGARNPMIKIIERMKMELGK